MRCFQVKEHSVQKGVSYAAEYSNEEWPASLLQFFANFTVLRVAGGLYMAKARIVV